MRHPDGLPWKVPAVRLPAQLGEEPHGISAYRLRVVGEPPPLPPAAAVLGVGFGLRGIGVVVVVLERDAEVVVGVPLRCEVGGVGE
jgi:hypothetical protein